MNEFDINIEIGSPWLLYIQVKTAAEEPLDLTGFTGSCQIRKAYGGDLVLSPTVTISDPAEGIVLLSLTNVQTAIVSSDLNGVYDFELTGPAPDFEVTRIVSGKAFLVANVVGPEYPITVDQGATWKLLFIMKNEGGDLKDLTNYSFMARIKTHRNATATLMSPAVSISLADSQVTLSLTDAETGALPAKVLFHECFMQGPTEAIKIFEGDLTVTPQVTA